MSETVSISDPLWNPFGRILSPKFRENLSADRRCFARHRGDPHIGSARNDFGIATPGRIDIIPGMGDQYRHGDVLIEAMPSLPTKRQKLGHAILAHGEVTGHCHRIREYSEVDLYQTSVGTYLHVRERSVSVVHEEHATIELPPGCYRVWRQREYTPRGIQVVRD